MKLFINARFLTQPITGVQRYGIECSLQIKNLNNDIIFLTPKNILHTELAEKLGARIIGSNTGHLWEQLDLPLFMNKQENAPLINLANTAPLAYRNNYITIHDLAFFHHPEWNSKLFSSWYNFLLPRVAKRSRYIFTVSQTIKKEIIQHYHIPEEKIGITYNGLSGEFLSQQRRLPAKKESIILSVGTFSKRKNQHLLVKAFLQSRISKTHKLVLIGDKNKIFTESGINEKELQNNNIIVLQKVSSSELAEMYSKAEVLVSLSGYEGFGIPILEGLYFGCKILCSDIPVYRELFSTVVSFCEIDEMTSIVNALEKIVTTNPINEDEKINLLLSKYNYALAAQTITEKVTSMHSAWKK